MRIIACWNEFSIFGFEEGAILIHLPVHDQANCARQNLTKRRVLP